jgi:hypothetical protein
MPRRGACALDHSPEPSILIPNLSTTPSNASSLLIEFAVTPSA